MAGFADLVAASSESIVYEDLRLGASNTWAVSWTFYDAAGTLINFSSCTAVLTIKGQSGTTLTTFTNTLTGGKQIVLGSNGVVTIAGTSGATTPFATTADFFGNYELKVTLGSDIVSLVRGSIKIFKPV